MSDLRVWQLDLDQPYALHIAADARFAKTDYADDQTWQVVPGRGESAAVALQTRYGGRAGLVSLVPMWHINGHIIYQAAQLAGAASIRGFAPGFAQLQMKLSQNVIVLAEFWAIDSHAVGGRFVLRNTSKQALEVRLDMIGFVGSEGREQPTKIIPLLTPNRHALALGSIGNLYPMLMLEDGFAPPEGGAGKVCTTIALKAGGRASVRFVCSGLPNPVAGLALAEQWLQKDWGTHFKRFSAASKRTPNIETGDADLDAALAFSQMQTLQAMISPTTALPHAALVEAREHVGAWAGANTFLAYQTALALAPIDAALAQGIVRNFIAMQAADGSIDAQAGASGQRVGYLCPPLLARLAWSVFQYTEDDAFIRDVFAPLVKAFERWLRADVDADGDGAPEWQDRNQLGFLIPQYLEHDVRRIESAGLVAYLLSEANSLKEIAYYLRDTAAETRMTEQMVKLKATLDTFWNAQQQRYADRDRDSHTIPQGQILLRDGRGDEEHILAFELDTPNRPIVEIEGGWQHTPKFTLHLHGQSADGTPIVEEVPSDSFAWRTGQGSYTSQHVFARVNRVQCVGLVRVYKVHVRTLDLAAQARDLHECLPLWALGASTEQAQAIRNALMDAQLFLGEHGLALVSADRVTHPYWTTVMGEGLIEYGYAADAAALAQRLSAHIMQHLKTHKRFDAYYGGSNAEQGSIAGVLPLHLLMRLWGVRVISATRVWAGGAYVWGTPIRIMQHGVVVERSTDGSRITFPSGKVVELASDAAWQVVEDKPDAAHD
jgi:hypothetical protein